MFLGHGHPAVVRAVTKQLADGSTYFLVNEPAIALADEVCRAVPCGEQIRSRRPEPRRRSSRCGRPAPSASATRS
jgi:glutamate-1-semialdehyde aminotransferase